MTRLLVIGSMLAAGCVPAAQRLAPSSVPVQGHVQVHVTADDGSVHVATADISQVEMQIESRGYEPGDLDISMTPNGNRVDIVAKIRHQWHLFSVTARSLHIEVRVPRDADVIVRSDDGSVEADAIAGNLDVHTGDGHVTVRQARGSIKLHTGDGSIDGEGLDGFVDATTGDGSVHVEGRFDALAVKTGDGHLVANALPGSRMIQPWKLRTGDGSVELGLPRGLGARIDASTNDGHISSAVPLQRFDSSHVGGDIYGGGPTILVRTGDGSISLNEI